MDARCPKSPGWFLLAILAATGCESTPGGIDMSLAVHDGDGTVAPFGTLVSPSPAVRVTDRDGQPLSGVIVNFEVTAGGGSVIGTADTSDAGGLAAISWLLGAAGPQTLRASVSRPGVAPVTFGATATTDVVLATVTPALTALPGPGSTATFSAKNQLGVDVAVSWRVNGVVGGNAAIGTITAGGAYTVPAQLPADSLIITAAWLADTTRRLSATAFLFPAPDALGNQFLVPRVIDASQPAETRLFLLPGAGESRVSWAQLATCSNTLPAGPCAGPGTNATPVGNGVLMIRLPHVKALAGHRLGALHNLAGLMDYYDAGGTFIRQLHLAVNVRDATMPDVPVTAVAADAQQSAFVLNLRVDALGLGNIPAVVTRALQLLGDRFDFIMLVSNAGVFQARSYQRVRNDVSGIGMPLTDVGATFGSAGRLRGIVRIPYDIYFETQAALAHEIGHAFINFATDTMLSRGTPHWPPSDLANQSVMGITIPGVNVGGAFPWGLQAIGGGQVRVVATAPANRYADWDLYLMGLLPWDSVFPARILPNPNPNSYSAGQITTTSQYTMTSYIAAHGSRSPAYGSAPNEFSIATVVLSFGRLLTPVEMAWYDAVAARAEATGSLPLSVGFGVGDSPTFHAVAGGRARLRARLN